VSCVLHGGKGCEEYGGYLRMHTVSCYEEYGGYIRMHNVTCYEE